MSQITARNRRYDCQEPTYNHQERTDTYMESQISTLEIDFGPPSKNFWSGLVPPESS